MTPAAATFSDPYGAASDTYTVPSTLGVEYRVNGVAVAAGTYPGTGLVDITAVADEGYEISGTSAWSHTFTDVQPATVVDPTQVDDYGTADDTFTIPSATGVQYRVDGADVAAGTYPGTGTVVVTAVAQSGYELTAGPDLLVAAVHRHHAGHRRGPDPGRHLRHRRRHLHRPATLGSSTASTAPTSRPAPTPDGHRGGHRRGPARPRADRSDLLVAAVHRHPAGLGRGAVEGRRLRHRRRHLHGPDDRGRHLPGGRRGRRGRDLPGHRHRRGHRRGAAGLRADRTGDVHAGVHRHPARPGRGADPGRRLRDRVRHVHRRSRPRA